LSARARLFAAAVLLVSPDAGQIVARTLNVDGMS
jgi:hypothetical protein